MLIKASNKKFLFGSTVIAGFAALTVVSGPAHAQTVSPEAAVAQQQSPEQGAPPQTAPDPAIVDQPDNPNEARNNAGEPTADDAGEVEAVVVTGSRIRRDPTNAPAPLIQLGREEILQSGEPNIVDFLADIPALQSSTVPEDTTGSNLNDGGLSLLNLRNLGAARTLVLVDGRRHVGASQGSLSVDVDSIPSLLVENAEVVTGGQSALYGADAVSGVVNFILRRNFEGIEIDGSLAQINQNGETNGRISGLAGVNLLDDRLNVYVFGEYQRNDEVKDRDIDFLRDGVGSFTDDVDPAGNQPDTTIDVRLVRDVRNVSRPRGGLITLSNQPIPSIAADRDTPIQVCPAITGTTNTGTISANCTAIRADDPNRLFIFNADGTARRVNFGVDQPQSGFSRANNVGGDGLNIGTEFSQGSRIPESDAVRFQTGFNFDIVEGVQIFGEAKYVTESNSDVGQPTFFNIGVVPLATPQTTPGFFAVNVFNIGLDNAFLPANVRTAIANNTRPQLNAAGAVIGQVVDPRAQLTIFGPDRGQTRDADVQRYVIGARGDRDSLGFVQNFSYEASYTYGKFESTNTESGLDSERFALALDSILVNGTPTCRAAATLRAGGTVARLNGTGNYTLSDPAIAGCVPINPFGGDFRADANQENTTGGGGRPGLSQAQADYITAAVNVEDFNEQHNFLSVISGELGTEFIGAGPIGVALGYEYRKDITGSSGRDRDTAGRALFLNTGLPFPETESSVNEVFAEVRLPLIQDRRFIEDLEVSGAYRYSDYSLLGGVDTYSLQGSYRPTRDVLFRATYGEATRIPNLGEQFDPGGQTFGNNLLDPCDSVQLALQTGQLAANRRANCIALLGPGYNPDTTRIVYSGGGVPGTSGGNLDLEPEVSRSYTLGAVFTPRFAPRLSLVLDYYNIKISEVIVSPTVQATLNGCVSGNTLNPTACDVQVRNGPTGDSRQQVPFALRDFRQIPLNFAARETQGVDFTARYSIDTADFIGRDLGRLDYSLRGNYLIRNDFFENIVDPGDATENDSLVGNPRVRLLSTLTYSPIENLSFTWDYDFQTSQEIRDSDFLLQDPDSRSATLLETGEFHQHDFSVRYELRDSLTVRAGVVNAFDEEPSLAAQANLANVYGTGSFNDIFDFFGRRFFVGANLKLGAARN